MSLCTLSIYERDKNIHSNNIQSDFAQFCEIQFISNRDNN